MSCTEYFLENFSGSHIAYSSSLAGRQVGQHLFASGYAQNAVCGFGKAIVIDVCTPGYLCRFPL